MASVPSTTRNILASLFHSSSLFASSSASSSAAVVRSATLSAPLAPSPSIWETLQGLWGLLPPIVLAVPKQRTSHSKKRLRSVNKQLDRKTNIVTCPACGLPKLSHSICRVCLSSITRSLKNEQRVKALLEGEEEAPVLDRVEAPLEVEAVKKE
ncbi:Mitochondrial ribosomal protein L32 [Phaffia rhodozyma]|uniref:Large ribosomal subunit protein bL32m n=1 Tax=Phaffia rhodozyma TaxID=264483 RepID=A0A0F7SI80_PHARH|nr:Mitochondrial ribosomal protein L32 [Phaffia rhodozyma]